MRGTPAGAVVMALLLGPAWTSTTCAVQLHELCDDEDLTCGCECGHGLVTPDGEWDEDASFLIDDRRHERKGDR